MSTHVEVKRVTVPQLMACKGQRKIVALTAHNVSTARIIDEYLDFILIGDSTAMVAYGLPNTLSFTLEQTAQHTAAVVRGTRHACIVADMPFGSYQESLAQAFRSAAYLISHGADAVKRIFGSPQKRELLKASFPSERAFLSFEAAMKREAAMYKNAQFVSPRTGSQTQLRQSDAEGFGGQAAAIAGDLALSAALPGRTVGGAIGRALTDTMARGQGITPGVADALSARMFTADPQAIIRNAGLLGQLEIDNALAQIARRRNAGMLLPGLAAGVNVAR